MSRSKTTIVYLFFFVLSNFVLVLSAYSLRGIMSFDNTAQDVIILEKEHNISLPLVWLLYDKRYDDRAYDLYELDEKLWERLYHITLSPDHYTAQDVADWLFDDQYRSFFRTIKQLRWHSIFRTMHEMNGWRYPRSWDPEAYKKARKHVVSLAEQEGVRDQLLFVFSVNHRDMPTSAETPSQQASLIQCTPLRKQETKCLTREDYRPWDEYVDLMGVTLYNRGKATSNRQRLSPSQILFDQRWQTYERLLASWKPLVIDEIWTSAVIYDTYYDSELSRKKYTETYDTKNTRLTELDALIEEHTEIIATLYFNRDYTQWLAYPSRGEADRAIFNPRNMKVYFGIHALFPITQKYETTIFPQLFWQSFFEWHLIPNRLWQKISLLIGILRRYDNPHQLLKTLRPYLIQKDDWSEVFWYVEKILLFEKTKT